jgi:urease accessory protein UreF
LPQFTITLSQKAVDRLQIQVQRTNDANGTTLTMRDWIELHLKEIAIADDLAIATQAIQEQQQRDAQDALQAAVRAQRDRLLEDLADTAG